MLSKMTNREQVVHFLTFVPAPGTNEAKPSDERKCDDMGRNWEAAGGFPRGDVRGYGWAWMVGSWPVARQPVFIEEDEYPPVGSS